MTAAGCGTELCLEAMASVYAPVAGTATTARKDQNMEAGASVATPQVRAERR